MQYLSTRGESPPLNFRATVMAGLAADGGLFLPEALPRVGAHLARWQALSFPELCEAVIGPFIGAEIDAATLRGLIARSYGGFDHAEVTPVVPVGPVHVVELFHGPTLAFKDVALQFLGNLFAHFLAASGERLTIVVATSGDTGSAAIHALRGKAGIEVFILFPRGRVSPMQELQMTTVPDANIHNIAVEGSFDDAQAIVKGLFNDRAFNAEFGIGAVNSINWARVMTQIVYYFYAYLRLCDPGRGRAGLKLGEPVRFAVPTGNFGNILAGHLARRMGLPIEKLILAANANDILHRFVQTGVYARGELHQSLSPSMDIQVASNFERYLYHLAEEDSGRLRGWLTRFQAEGRLEVGPDLLEAVQAEFASARVDDAQTLETIRQVHDDHGYLLDPHGAVAMRAALEAHGSGAPVVCLATAHPAKFGEAIARAIGAAPPLPDALAGLRGRPTRVAELPATLSAVQEHIRACVVPLAAPSTPAQ